jgi:hypothetical protein
VGGYSRSEKLFQEDNFIENQPSGYLYPVNQTDLITRAIKFYAPEIFAELESVKALA